MELSQIYSFLFESYAGIGVLVGAGIIISLLVSIILEVKTRRQYKNHEPVTEEDAWAIFEEDVAKGFAEEEAELNKDGK